MDLDAFVGNMTAIIPVAFTVAVVGKTFSLFSTPVKKAKDKGFWF